MGDVRLGMELITIVNTAFNLAGLKRLKNCGHTIEERIGILICLDTGVEHFASMLSHGIQYGLARTMVRVRSHQYANFTELLPFAIEGEKCANLEMPSGNIEPLGNTAPFLKVAEGSPAR